MDVAVRPWDRSWDPDEPLRASWARPGGPAEDLAWADAALERGWDAAHGARGAGAVLEPVEPLAPAHDSAATAWLKVVPPFFAHEGAILAALGADRVPEVLGIRRGPHAARRDPRRRPLRREWRACSCRWSISSSTCRPAWVGRVDDLLELRLPDWRRDALTVAFTDLVARWRGRLPEAVEVGLDGLLDGLAARWDHIDECGLPDTLVHGDFHQGNLRSAGPGHLVLLDWGDSGIGHPMLDQSAFLDRLSPADRQAVRQAWTDAVASGGPRLRARPGGVPARAHRRAPTGADLPAVPGRHRARRADLPRARSGGLARAGRRPRPGLIPAAPKRQVRFGWWAEGLEPPTSAL